MKHRTFALVALSNPSCASLSRSSSHRLDQVTLALARFQHPHGTDCDNRPAPGRARHAPAFVLGGIGRTKPLAIDAARNDRDSHPGDARSDQCVRDRRRNRGHSINRAIEKPGREHPVGRVIHSPRHDQRVRPPPRERRQRVRARRMEMDDVIMVARKIFSQFQPRQRVNGIPNPQRIARRRRPPAPAPKACPPDRKSNPRDDRRASARASIRAPATPRPRSRAPDRRRRYSSDWRVRRATVRVLNLAQSKNR